MPNEKQPPINNLPGQAAKKFLILETYSISIDCMFLARLKFKYCNLETHLRNVVHGTDIQAGELYHRFKKWGKKFEG
jgi:hypothetical protein